MKIANLRGNNGLSGREAYEFAGLLTAVIDSTDDATGNEFVRDQLSRLIGRLSDQRLATLLDWWMVVRLGARSNGLAFNLAESVPDAPVAAMDGLREFTRSTEIPALLGLRLRRRLAETLAEFAEELHHESGKVGVQGTTWLKIEANYRPVYEELAAGRAPTSPALTKSDIRAIMREHDVRPSSDIWRKIERDWERLDDLCDQACRLASGPNGNYSGPVPAVVDVQLSSSGTSEGLVERFVLRDLLKSEVPPESLVLQLVDAVEPLDDLDREWLAWLTFDWSEQSRVPLRSLSQEHGRIRALRKEIHRLERTDVDLDMTRIHLSEGLISLAEQALRDVKSVRADQDRERNLRDELTKLETLAGTADTDEQLRRELAVARQYLDAGDLGSAQERLPQLREELASQLLLARVEEARELIASLGQYATPIPSAIAERNANGETTAEDLDELRDLFDQVESTVRARVSERLRVGVARLDSERQLLDTLTIDLVETLLEGAQEAYTSDDLPQADEGSRRALVLLDQSAPKVWKSDDGEGALVDHLRKYVTDRLGFSTADIDRLYVGLKTKRFAILSGLTGSGKSTIARHFAESLGASKSNGRFLRVAVRPNWVDESEVLGYVNPMTQRFEPGWLASLIKTCERYPDLPVFCLLDEMNLAPVEYYLADYLSALEEASTGSDTTITLYPSGATPSNAEDWPHELPFPENLFLIGTVNVDESTRALSDRVLDRANVIQLTVMVNDQHHSESTDGDVEPRWQVRMRDWRSVATSQPTAAHHEFLVEIGEILRSKMYLGLGVRAHLEIERFIANAEGVLGDEEALDLALLQRVIPKIRGFKRDLLDGLAALRAEFQSVNADLCQTVLESWLADTVSDDAFIDGTHTSVGLVSSR